MGEKRDKWNDFSKKEQRDATKYMKRFGRPKPPKPEYLPVSRKTGKSPK